MKKRLKKVMSLILVATMAMALLLVAGCGSEEESVEATSSEVEAVATEVVASGSNGTFLDGVTEDETYIVVNCLNNIEYFNAQKYGWEKTGEMLGVNVEFTGPADDSMTDMGNAFDSAMAKNPAGICIWGYDAAMDSYIEKAQDAGIPVVTFVGSTDVTGDCYIGTSQYDIGYQGGVQYAESIGESGTVAILTITGQDMFEERQRGFEDAFAEYPGIEVVATVDTKADTETAVSVAKDVLVKYPDLTGFVCADSTGASGAATAKSELGLSDVQVIGLDRNTDTLEMIKDGTITGTLAQDDVYISYWALMTLFTMNHVDLYLSADDAASGAKSAPNYIYTAVNLITPDNVDYYLEANEYYKDNSF